MSRPIRLISVRHRIVGLLAGFSLVAYILRMNISIAAKFMMPELGLTQIQMGQIFSSFMVGYAIFQIPWGVWGDRVGPRVMLTLATLSWAVTTALTGLLPGILVPAGLAAFLCLLALRFLLGTGQAAVYPLAARAVANWLPSTERAFGYSWIIAASAAGSAFTGPVVAWCMVTVGWRASFYLTGALAVIAVGVWHWYATDHPDTHADISAEELSFIKSGRTTQERPSGSWLPLLRNRNISLICVSYFLDTYVLFMFIFWFYLYLVEERKFSILSGGLFSSTPYLLSLAVVPAAGYLSDYLCKTAGRRLGRRLVAMGGFAVSAGALFVGVRAADAYFAIGALSVSVAFLMATEGPFWSSAIDVGGTQSGASAGIMNMAGNLGGVVSTALVPILVKEFGWMVALGSGSIVAVIAGLIWLLIRVDQSQTPEAEVNSVSEAVRS